MPKYVMSDGREFTDYNPACVLNEMIQQKYKITNSHQYREFLQKNAEEVRKALADCDTKRECKICSICQKALEIERKQ
jgi:hypothetical protein